MPVTVIKDVLEEHFEELQILLEQRQANLRSPLRTLRHLQELDERIETHVQGLLIGDDETIHLLCDGLASDDLSVIFASAYTLLRFGTRDEAIRVIEAFRVARPSQY